MKKTQIGIVGLGDRGRDLLDTLLMMDDVEIVALCDVMPERLKQANDLVEKTTGKRTKELSDYKTMLADDAIQAVIVATSWNNHVALSIQAMRAGKYAAFEVGPASSLETPWQLVRAYDETRVPCMMLCNCDYGEKELAVLRMIREGLFGEITHVEGGYHHDMRRLADPKHLAINERSWQNLARCGDLYPDHSLGPIFNYLNINRGNRMLSLVSMASKARNMTRRYQETKTPDMPDRDFKIGDVIITLIKCANGETILLNHDTCIARPYSRAGFVEGTLGVWSEEMKSIHLESMEDPEKWESDESFLEKYRHPFWRDKEKMKEWHHGGMDYLTLRSFVNCVKNKTNTPVDAYDAATLLAIPVLTEESIQQGSAPVAIPDFTGGRWLHREPQSASVFSLDQFHDELFEGEWSF